MKYSLLDYKLNSQNTSNCIHCINCHLQRNHCHKKVPLLDHKLSSSRILLNIRDMLHFIKSIQNRMKNKMMDCKDCNQSVCWHKYCRYCFPKSNYQSIKYNELGHTLRSESILNHKLDMLHLRHKIQPNMKYKPLGYMLHINQILSCKCGKNRFPQRIPNRKSDNLSDHKCNNQNILSCICYKFHH